MCCYRRRPSGTLSLVLLCRVHTESGGAARLHTKSTYRRVPGACLYVDFVWRRAKVNVYVDFRRFRCERGLVATDCRAARVTPVWKWNNSPKCARIYFCKNYKKTLHGLRPLQPLSWIIPKIIYFAVIPRKETSKKKKKPCREPGGCQRGCHGAEAMHK